MSPRARQPARAKSSEAPRPAAPERPAQPVPAAAAADFEKLGVFYLGRAVRPRGQAARAGLAPLRLEGPRHPRGVHRHDRAAARPASASRSSRRRDRRHPRARASTRRATSGICCLTFPELARRGLRAVGQRGRRAPEGARRDAYAAQQAELWRKGLADVGRGRGAHPAAPRRGRRRHLHARQHAGLPISILESFARAAAGDRRRRGRLPRARHEHRVTGLLGLLGIDADPLRSREHILVATLLERAWREGKDLDLAGLIQRDPEAAVRAASACSTSRRSSRRRIASRWRWR